MSTFKYLPQYFSTTLNVGGGIDASQTTGIVLLSVSGVDITKPGQICISYSDPLDTGVAEWINYTSINGSNELVGVTRGCEGYSAHTHLPSAVIQFTLSATHINDLADVVNGIKAKDLVTTAGGTTTYTLTPTPAVGAYVTGQEFNIKMNATNTGASTINVSGLGAKSLTKGGATALASGDLLIDAVYKIVYDGTQFQVSGISAAAATIATAAEVTTGTDNTKMVTPLAAQALGGADGWTAATGTWTYASASTITVPSGAASIYQKGDRIKWTQTTVKYGVIVAVADTLLTIAVNTDYTVANAAISANYYSHQANPLGYPIYFNFTPTLSASGSMTYTATTVSHFKYSITGNQIFLAFRFTGTVGGTPSTTITATLPCSSIVGGNECRGTFIFENPSGTTSAVEGYAGSSNINFRNLGAGNYAAGIATFYSSGYSFQF